MQFQSDCRQILMTIMNTNYKFDIHPYKPRRVGEFVTQIQDELLIQPRSFIKLNRASPIHQGVGKDYRRRKYVHCKATAEKPRLAIRIAACERLSTAWWFGVSTADPFGVFACRLCYYYRMAKGKYPQQV